MTHFQIFIQELISRQNGAKNFPLLQNTDSVAILIATTKAQSSKRGIRLKQQLNMPI